MSKKVLITAGSTYERIDTVRAMIANFSSGKMGLEMAKSFLALQYDVYCIIGRVEVSFADIYHTCAYTAQDMMGAVKEKIQQYDMYVSTAAISDYRPVQTSATKISGENIIIEFTKNQDILQYVYNTYPDILVAGFTIDDSPDAHFAKKKLKKADCIIRNYHTAIGSNSNSVDIITKDNFVHINPMGKDMIAMNVAKFLDSISS